MAKKIHKCENPGCGKEFEQSRSSHKFCSDACRYNDKKVKRLAGPGEQAEIFPEGSKPVAPVHKEKEKEKVKRQSIVSIQSTLDPAAALMVDLLQKEADKSEKLYDKEREISDTLRKENQKLRDELAQLKTDMQIAEMESRKPTGLQGFIENPLFKELVPHIGPSLGRLLETWLTPGQQIAGVNGQLDEEVQAQLVEFNQWFSSLPKERQTSIYRMLEVIAKSGNPDQLIEQINSLLKNGTTIENSGPSISAMQRTVGGM